ncbi:helix-turn-helix domain-containing protein [Candidatus Falkowbacteria bacterium]|nr:helix-turn-helix domain-containing protein [Candidatus Falkowbacteria bacterium]
MNFTTKQVSATLTVAEILSAARKEQGVDLEKIEKFLKINKKYLRALEDGRYDILPSLIYTKNFAKTYGEYLGLDTEHLGELIEKELGIVNQLSPQRDQPIEPEYLQSKILLTPKMIRYGLAITLALTCLGYLSWQVNAIFSSPRLSLTEPQPDLITQQNSITVIGDTLPEIDLLINNQTVLTDPAGHFTVALDLQTGLNTITVSAKKKHSQPSILTRQVLYQPIEVIEGTAPENPAKPEL